ncbi:uncharacterized protein zgc:113279 [Syngnathoides biaculeatus]|uniref:uncharacterized protein zgc:113279 n=1 Tax=Syngnathoides biaculeatus TaxID=300417 RepID=UPI002ADE16B3|nr:uncharacterized protein zgc:113279 [Syngnathoides biaculeatus]
MRGHHKQLKGKERDYSSAHPVSQPPGTASDMSIQEVDDWETVSKHTREDVQKVYLGVRVKMPVKDLLRNIRIAQGRDPKDLQRKRPTNSLEELAIIVEVLEEDLRTETTNPIQMLSPSSPVSPDYTSEPNGTGYNSDESDEIIPSPPSYTIYSPGTSEYQQTLPPLGAVVASLQSAWTGDYWLTNSPNSSSEFFWAQLQKEELKLRNISDEALLATDQNSRTALHSVVCDGKRALAYAIAKRMAPLNSLDLKDSNGMTALLLAAKHNHHLIVEDLIHLGACVSERNNLGKSCLHLSAEKGFIRVLEVLKRVMMEGVYIDVEATDNYGMSVLQCASVALKVTLQQLEVRKSLSHTRLHTLRKEQLLETLECLLQMASYSHVMSEDLGTLKKVFV